MIYTLLKEVKYQLIRHILFIVCFFSKFREAATVFCQKMFRPITIIFYTKLFIVYEILQWCQSFPNLFRSSANLTFVVFNNYYLTRCLAFFFVFSFLKPIMWVCIYAIHFLSL